MHAKENPLVHHASSLGESRGVKRKRRQVKRQAGSKNEEKIAIWERRIEPAGGKRVGHNESRAINDRSRCIGKKLASRWRVPPRKGSEKEGYCNSARGGGTHVVDALPEIETCRRQSREKVLQAVRKKAITGGEIQEECWEGKLGDKRSCVGKIRA